MGALDYFSWDVFLLSSSFTRLFDLFVILDLHRPVMYYPIITQRDFACPTQIASQTPRKCEAGGSRRFCSLDVDNPEAYILQ